MLQPFEYSRYSVEMTKSQLQAQVNKIERWVIGGLVLSEIAKHNHNACKKALDYAKKYNFGLNDTVEVEFYHAENI